ncbi:hypothetical protein ACFWNU_22275, partial [Streptomyces sp. NPDC058427]|uniref:hypothetical protein n=1 Tax=Streptomyces sp. NPDC058427 TaxID=3346494 RepID=UPI00364FCAF9
MEEQTLLQRRKRKHIDNPPVLPLQHIDLPLRHRNQRTQIRRRQTTSRTLRHMLRKNTQRLEPPLSKSTHLTLTEQPR